jgi:hypothetical protein
MQAPGEKFYASSRMAHQTSSARSKMLTRLSVAAGLVLLCALSITRIAVPPSPVPATAADTVFSAERAMRHVEQIAVRPHAVGMPDHARVRDYILAQLTALGVKPSVQSTTAVSTRVQSAGRVENILAWMPGSDPSGKAVLLVAHYDGVAAGPAASDDAAGCAALLETLRALRARKTPLRHDIFVLFSDGEEAGLLGAAAFVREHRWAKDVAFVLNFEARGTSGRSLMFETGAGNLGSVRALRSAGNATAGSVFTTIYRRLPNDTDLSELSMLGVPALNFAFTEGVERYHTSDDDVAHLNPGSLQHHGSQMLAATREVADHELPLAKTGDAVFFDFPLLGLVVYPQALAVPFAILALLFAGFTIRPRRREALIASLGLLAAMIVSCAIGTMIVLSGPARWSGLWATAIVLLMLAVNTLAMHVTKRWSTDARGGALVVWAVLTAVSCLWVPGASYLFLWPFVFATIAARWPRPITEWLSAAVTIFVLVGGTYGTSVVLLGLAGAGVLLIAINTSQITWALSPLVAKVQNGARFGGAPYLAGAAVVVGLIAAVAVRPSAAHPTPSTLVYVERANDTSAVLAATDPDDAWARGVVGAHTTSAAWIQNAAGSRRAIARDVARIPLDMPTATLLRDTIIANARRVVFRVNVPQGTTAVRVEATGAPVSRTAIDARVVDTTRFRFHPATWTTVLWAVPDSGMVVSLTVPLGRHLDISMTAHRPGLPAIPGMSIPARPSSVAPNQRGDETVLVARTTF